MLFLTLADCCFRASCSLEFTVFALAVARMLLSSWPACLLITAGLGFNFVRKNMTHGKDALQISLIQKCGLDSTQVSEAGL